MEGTNTYSLLSLFLLLSLASTRVQGQTRVGFYSSTCPRAETIVRNTVQSYFDSDATVAGGLVRIHFHDCFIQGCDASVLIDGANTEKNAIPNLSVKGYDVIEDAKTAIEAACPGVVSCADILALAARDSVVAAGGQSWSVPTGRRDGLISRDTDAANLPSFRDSVAVQRQKFSAIGLSTQDLVVLVGGDGNRRIALDNGSQNRFDNNFFVNLRNERGILESDQALWTDNTTRPIVQLMSPTTIIGRLLGPRFGTEFGRSMVRMSNVGVKTGTQGEIRRVCTAIN